MEILVKILIKYGCEHSDKNGNGWLISMYSEDALIENGLDRLFSNQRNLFCIGVLVNKLSLTLLIKHPHNLNSYVQ